MDRDIILGLVKGQGPVIPADIAKTIGKDIIMTSAIMAELVSSKKLLISNIKYGGSPYYYLPGQEEKLQNYAERLNEKDKVVYNKLKDKKVLRDRDQEPLTRVSLRNIKDFAKPLTVTLKGYKEIFWKWYLTPDEEAGVIIKDHLGLDVKDKPKEIPDDKVLDEMIKVEEEIEDKVEKKEERKKDEQKVEKKAVKVEELDEQIPIQKAEKKPKKEKKTVQKKLAADNNVDEFMIEIIEHLKIKEIEVEEHEIIKKGSEVDMILNVPSAVGSVKYYCKAKKKVRVNEGDLSSAFVTGQVKKLPVLFLTRGNLTKRAKDMLKGDLNSITFSKIGE